MVVHRHAEPRLEGTSLKQERASLPPEPITSAFSIERRNLLEDFANLDEPRTGADVSAVWSRHFYNLVGARGIFAVSDAQGQHDIPGNVNFSDKGSIRCWLEGGRFILLQNAGSTREFRYGSTISCDTNFVSFCEAFDAGRDLGTLAVPFAEAVRYLLPISDSVDAFPYLVENADNPDRDMVFRTAKAFVRFKKSSLTGFETTGGFDGDETEASRIATGLMAGLDSPDFRTLQGHFKNRYQLIHVILLKAVLLSLSSQRPSGDLFFDLLKFLHARMARLLGFETYVAFEYFRLNSQLPFFSPVQRNARDLKRKLRGMAWDLTHWRAMFDMLSIDSARSETAFRFPHFLTFDTRFAKLTEHFQLQGIIFHGSGTRCDQLFSRVLTEPVSELLESTCALFCTEDAIADRSRRATAGDINLPELEQELLAELDSIVSAPANP